MSHHCLGGNGGSPQTKGYIMKRKFARALIIAIILSLTVPVVACDKEQTNAYVTQVLLGEKASKYENDKSVKMLLNALYLCSEQHDNSGQDELKQLKRSGGRLFASLSSINISGGDLLECSHNSWEYTYAEKKSAQTGRKKLLRQTVNTVFDFGLFNKWFDDENEKCNSFSAMLYYIHILCDYIAEDPYATETVINGKTVSSYYGEASVEVNGNIPSFTAAQKKNTKSYSEYSPLDSLGRAGVAIANIGKDSMPPADSRQNIGSIKPTGWNQDKYSGFVNSDPGYLYNRCHLIAHQLDGNDKKENLITGTRYLNIDGMKNYEDEVVKYILKTGNHVLYRATPIFEGDNLVASGVQLEAYSIEDSGELHFNVFCYNVQPGISINYANGCNEVIDEIYYNANGIQFAVSNVSDSNPDLMYEIDRHLKIIFDDQQERGNYTEMMKELKDIARDARDVGSKGEKEAQRYAVLKKYEYKYLDILKKYIPWLLAEEDFFTSRFD